MVIKKKANVNKITIYKSWKKILKTAPLGRVRKQFYAFGTTRITPSKGPWKVSKQIIVFL